MENSVTQIISKKIVPPTFLSHILEFKRYEVYYGGRGSGKSTYVARKLILRSRINRYFKCIYVRKNSEHIRDSQFSLLKTQIKALRLEHEFKILEGTMKIIHLATGNSFIAKGVNDPEKVKSTDEPSHLWCEEVTELEIEDFFTLDKSIRTTKSEISAIITFNPVHESSWVRQHFFAEDDPHAAHQKFGDKILIHRSTYKDNVFIDRDSYYDTLLLSAGGNRNRIRVDVEGDWGLMENNAAWLYAFDPDKHIKDNILFLPTFPVYLSFDFNREPATCIAFQQSPLNVYRSPNTTLKDAFIHYIKEFAGDFQLDELCQQIKTSFPASIFFVTGDAAGNKGDVGFAGRHSTYYTMIKSYLSLSEKQMHINSRNLEHNDSRLLCNTILHQYPNVYFSQSGCPKLIDDCIMAQVDENSSKAGHLKKDRKTFKLDLFDGFRYSLQTYYNEFAKSNYFTIKPIKTA